MQTALITGSNRGLGLEWARQCAGKGWRVLATCRDPESAVDLRDLADQGSSVRIHRLDATGARQVGDLSDAAPARRRSTRRCTVWPMSSGRAASARKAVRSHLRAEDGPGRDEASPAPGGQARRLY